MRILYISNEYPPDTGFGGIGTYCQTMARGMAALGNEVHIIARSDSGVPQLQTDGQIQIHRVSAGMYPLPAHIIFYLFRKACRAFIPHSLVRLAWAKQVFQTFSALQSRVGTFDIVEYPECGAEGFYFRNLKKPATTVVLARLHTPWEIVASCNETRENPIEKRLLSYLEQSSVRNAQSVSSPTKALANYIREKWHVENIAVIPNPIQSDAYGKTQGTDWIYTGRVERRKGVHILIEAYAKLTAFEKLPRLRIVGRPYGSFGNKEYGSYIEEIIKKNKLSENIEWIKGTDHQTVSNLLSQSAVAIFPSLWENMAYSCLEAMACGCTVIASRCGGFPEIIQDKQNGLLFETQSVESLADNLYYIYKDQALAKKLGIAARESIVAKYDIGIVGKQTMAWYKSQIDALKNII